MNIYIYQLDTIKTKQNFLSDDSVVKFVNKK